jgi:hypothetical protein
MNGPDLADRQTAAAGVIKVAADPVTDTVRDDAAVLIDRASVVRVAAILTSDETAQHRLLQAGIDSRVADPSTVVAAAIDLGIHVVVVSQPNEEV